MGGGLVLKCKKCGRSYEVFDGVGFAFPSDYERLFKEVGSGKHGARLQEALLSVEGADIDSEEHVYFCSGTILGD